MRQLWGYQSVIAYERVDYGGCGAWVRGVLGNLVGLWVWSTLKDSLISLITFSISVCWVGKSTEYFLWTHVTIVRQEYTPFDFDS